MNKAVISDTSCLIALDRIHRLEILKDAFSEIITTKEVKQEFGKPLPKWIVIKTVKDSGRKKELANLLDAGEASAIALAIETKKSLLIIDEKKGRRIARELKIEIIGTLRVLLFAKEKGLIGSVKEIIEGLEQNGFRFTKNIRREILKEAKEL